VFERSAQGAEFLPMVLSGWLALVLCTVGAFLGMVVGLLRPKASAGLRALQFLTAAASAATFVALAALVARGDPSVAYAVQHRAPADAPLGYRVGAVWAGQEGGLLLWALEMALLALALRPARQARAAAVLFAIQACLLGLTLAANPFRFSSGDDGPGLNPLLRHPMMLIHPPLLFLGYALLAVPYAITVGALVEGASADWAPRVRPWLLVAWLALTAGNGFGAEWAYKTFGWGGFWSWDPVENASFVPWMLTAAAVHLLWLSGRGARVRRAAAICTLGAFLAVLYGSFLARSGLLGSASVHAYVAGDRLMQWALGTLLAGALLAAAVCLGARWRQWEGPACARQPLAATLWGSGVMVTIAALVLVGMSLPVVGYAPVSGAYNVALTPLAIVLLILLALSITFHSEFVHWMALVLTTAVPPIVVMALGIFQVIPVSERYTHVGAWMVGLLMCVPASWVLALSLREVVSRRRPFLQRSHAFSHLGVALLLMGAAVSGTGVDTAEVFLQPGREQTVLQHRLTLHRVGAQSPGRARAELAVDGLPGTLEVEHNPAFNIELRRPFIRRGLLRDVYITPLALVPQPTDWEGQSIPVGAMLQVSDKPLMSFVWAGMIFIAAGQILALVRRWREGA
jgi:cytochrome c-type biogenesis protein CcmF